MVSTPRHSTHPRSSSVPLATSTRRVTPQGKFGTSDPTNKNALGARPDGSPYVWPKYVVPNRLYVGKKGFNAQGQPASDFLSRNGLAYGQVYGFATDLAAHDGARDEPHRVRRR